MFPAWNSASISDVNNFGFSINSTLSELLDYDLSGP